ncbi:MAG TPA: NINE protein [Pricia antarctica]|uniref:NINE protein n=1 Tax=Pricia antarctica TaxID=641691 RepID=A0A831QNF2_9FLAO|nr:NINE protein [Pricia antarctica]
MSDEEKKFGKGSEGSFDKGNKKSSEFGKKANEGFEKGKESSKSFSDDTKKSAKDFGDRAQEEFKKAKESTKGFAGDSKKAANDFGEGAKKTANEFREGAKEAFSGVGGENKKVLAGILAIVLGGFGIHKFILGYTKEGIIMLVVTIGLGAITCGMAASAVWIIGVIEGIIYLTKTDEEFYNIYQVGRKPWF